MGYFPVFMDLSDKTVLIVGGGAVAERRLTSILPFAGQVIVVADQISRSLERFLEDSGDSGRVRVCRRPFVMQDMDGAFMVLACTDDEELNRRITAECRKRGILGNNASDKKDCDFFFPGLIHRDPVVIGFTAGGQAHSLVKELRMRTEKIVEEVCSKEVCRKAEEHEDKETACGRRRENVSDLRQGECHHD